MENFFFCSCLIPQMNLSFNSFIKVYVYIKLATKINRALLNEAINETIIRLLFSVRRDPEP